MAISKAGKEFLGRYELLFRPFNNVRISFDTHHFEAQFIGIEMASITKMPKMLPDKRPGLEGKFYTPSFFVLKFNTGNMYFVVEDTIMKPIIGGVELYVGETLVVMESM